MKVILNPYIVRGTLWVAKGSNQNMNLVSGPRVRILAASYDKAINAYMDAMRQKYGPCVKDTITVVRP